MLHFRRQVPKVIAHAESVNHVVGELDRVGIALAEIDVVDRSAFAVRREIGQVAVRDVIPVGIVPRAAGAVD